jgi:hypothetical protein
LDDFAEKFADKDSSANRAATFDRDDGDEERRPTANRLLNCKYKLLYRMYYVSHCNALGTVPVALNKFYMMRRKLRPNIKRNKQYLRRGWDHTRCADCDWFARRIASLNLSTEERLKHEVSMMDHIKKQLEHRQVYYKRRAKVINSGNKKNVSMMVDGAGSTGLTFCPRACRVAKDMKPRHNMMKIKSTFSKIHGYGIRIRWELGHSSQPALVNALPLGDCCKCTN